MKKFLYETHLHTCQGSACGRSEGKLYPQLYKDLGYDGIFITDHFFGGNTAAPREGDWKHRVDVYMSGYEDARSEGEKIGLKVFFGIEQGFGPDEVLIYGLDREYLYEHPDIEKWSRAELYRHAHEAGAAVVQAHPFRERGYISEVKLSPYCVDAVEAVNLGNEPYMDLTDTLYGKTLNLPLTAGSDIHKADNVRPGKASAVELTEELHSATDYANYLLARKPITLHYPNNRFTNQPVTRPHSPVIIYDRDDQRKEFIWEEWIKE